MKRSPTLFLRGAVYLMGITVLATCIFALPAGIASSEVGSYRPILVGLYVPAIPFFFALYQTLKLLGYIDQNKAFSNTTIQALKNIKYSAVLIGALFTVGLPYVYYVADKDDAPGVLALALAIAFMSAVIAVFAAVLQRLFQNAMDIKSENDLTV